MFWFFGLEACEVLAPWPGIEPTLPALEVLTTEPPGKSPPFDFELTTEKWNTLIHLQNSVRGPMDPLGSIFSAHKTHSHGHGAIRKSSFRTTSIDSQFHLEAQDMVCRMGPAKLHLHQKNVIWIWRIATAELTSFRNTLFFVPHFLGLCSYFKYAFSFFKCLTIFHIFFQSSQKNIALLITWINFLAQETGFRFCRIKSNWREEG